MFVRGAGAALALPAVAAAQTTPISMQAALVRLFSSRAAQRAWFAPTFLAAVPLAKVQSIVADIIATLGPYRSVAKSGVLYTVTFTRGTIRAEGSLDTNGAFAALLLSRMQSAAVAARIAALFHTTPVPAAWFSQSMLVGVTIDQIRHVVRSMSSQYGALADVTPATDGSYDVRFANGDASALAFLGPDGTFEGLLFQRH
jgi:hypothetical protein